MMLSVGAFSVGAIVFSMSKATVEPTNMDNSLYRNFREAFVKDVPEPSFLNGARGSFLTSCGSVS